ncbi:MAG: HEPN domain-containing protein [Caldilinea sp.]
MTADQQELLEEAQDSIDAAKLLLENGFAGYAASRAYYAMLYVAECLLEGEALSFSKHSAVIAAFGQHFARSGRVPTEFHRYLIEGQALRQSGDYGQRNAVSMEQARLQIERAEEFVALARRLIKTDTDNQ